MSNFIVRTITGTLFVAAIVVSFLSPTAMTSSAEAPVTMTART